MLAIGMAVPGEDIKDRQLRKTLCRYCTLMAVLLFRTISQSVGYRLKTMHKVANAGFITQSEIKMFNKVETDINKFWLPAMWFVHRLREAKEAGKIDSYGAKIVMSVGDKNVFILWS